MKVEIVSPEGKLLDSQAELVSLPGVHGAFEILDNHAPLIALLGKGIIRIKGKKVQIDEDVESKFERMKDEVRLKINGGTVEVNNNRVIILVEL